jgi:uncharacterized protein Yka (UPF0111/DUF47 family)
MPKEEKYFEDFKEMIRHIGQMADWTNQIFSSDEINQNLILKIKPLEVRCDEIYSKVVKRLNKTFITPFDREDIYLLTKRLDDISDMLFGATARIETFNIKRKIKYADKLSSIILEQISELGKAIQDLKVKSINECKIVKTLETEADKIYQNAIKELFEEEKDPIEIIKKKEILEILENTCDKCQTTANVILSIFIKNA